MTLEDIALAIHQDYHALSKKMDTKLWPIERDIKTMDKNLRELRNDVQTITEVMVSKADLANTMADELAKSEYARQLQDVRNRVDVLEHRLGIKPTHRAA